MEVSTFAKQDVSMLIRSSDRRGESWTHRAFPSSRLRKIAKLTVAACLLIGVLAGCGPRLKSNDWEQRRDAVDRISDQRVLAKVAMSDPAPFVRMEAGRRLTDSAVIVEVAMNEKNDPNPEGGVSAVENLNDQALLTKIAYNAPNWDVRKSALRKIPGQHGIYELLVKGSPTLKYELTKHFEANRCLARMKLVTQESIIKAHFPRLQCEGSLTEMSQSYGYHPAGFTEPPKNVSAENDTISFLQDDKMIVQTTWEAEFPTWARDGQYFPAHVSCGDLTKKLLQRKEFTPGDLNELINSYIPEIREAARWNIDNWK
jgi:hypothetical protein